MIPLHDTVRSRSIPLMNWALIAANLLVFLFELTLGPRALATMVSTFGLMPRRLLANPGSGQFLTLFTSMFLHGGWWHLIGNLWVLFIFGDSVQDRMGHLRYLVFYLFCGLAAALAHVGASPLSRIPTIGASGAISGVMGAYVVLFPRARVLTLVPFFFLPRLIELQAFLFIGFWLVSQIFNGLFSLMAPGDVHTYGGVAWWAHVGGFLAGLLLVKLFERRHHDVDEYR
jgi:membrane associated rhomboid family serine protease